MRALRHRSRTPSPARTCTALPALLVAIAALGPPASAPAETRQPRIANGVTTTDQPTTGALLFGATDTQICSGTLIGCRTFLTAAHCVCNENGSTCDPLEASHRVYLQHAGVFSVSQITPNPSFVDFPAAANDVAVVTLASAVDGIDPTPIASSPPPFGTTGTIAGFGNLDDDPRTGSGIKREGAVTTTSCAPSGAPDGQYLCWDPDPPFGPPGTDSNTCPGDSGGPLFTTEGGETVVSGAVSFGLGPCAGDDFSGVANVASYAGWIASVAGADLQAACGTLPPVGDAATGVSGFDGALSGPGDEQVHTFVVPADTDLLRVTLNGVEDATEDFDLWVRFGAPPVAGQIDCASESFSQFEACAFDSPAAGTWYAKARSIQGDGAYQVTATAFAGVPTCGNLVVQAGEACDDGNQLPGDGCDALCQLEGTLCGNGLVESPETCDDGNTRPGDGCDALCQLELPGCLAVPDPNCTALTAGSTKLKLRQGSKPGKEKLRWTWRPRKIKGVVPAIHDFSASDHRLCVYETTAGVASLAFEADAPAGPQWTEKRNGLRFEGSGAPGELEQLKIGTKPRIALAAKARAIPALPLAQDAEVVVQLQDELGRCWESRYASPAKKNDARRFSDRSKLR